MLAFDPSHPIQHTDTIDVTAEFEGGAYHGLVISSPMKGDSYSQRRLLKKIESYIGDFYSERSRVLFGAPTAHKCRIYVQVHSDSDEEVFRLLENCRTWVEDNGVGFIVEKIDAQNGN